MIRFIGVLMLSGIPIGIGFSKSRMLYKQKEEMEGLIFTIHHCYHGIAYQQLPLGQILDSLPPHKYEVVDQIKKQISLGYSPKIAWEQVKGRMFEASAKRIMDDFFSILGTSDRDMQIEFCKATICQLEQLKEKTSKDTSIKAKLYRTVGLLMGAFIAIVFI